MAANQGQAEGIKEHQPCNCTGCLDKAYLRLACVSVADPDHVITIVQESCMSLGPQDILGPKGTARVACMSPLQRGIDRA